MAATFVQENSGDSGSAAAASYSVTLGSGTTTGNHLVIIVAADATVTTPSGFTVDKSQVNNNGHYVYRKATTAGETSWTVSPSSSAAGCWYVAEISGLAGSPVDQVVSTGAGTSATTRSTGTTGTTTQAAELALATWCSSRAANPASSWSGQTNSFTERITDRSTTKASGTNIGLCVASRDLTTTGTYESTATASTTTASTGVLVTYKEATAASPIPGQPQSYVPRRRAANW